jgi:NitT/TauT family transport system permease protein
MKGFVVPVVLVLAAEIAAAAVDLHSDSLARPSAVALALAQALADGTIARATGETLTMALTGLAIGAALGLLGGVLLGLSRPADRLMVVSVEVFRPIPSVALIPIAMLVFGFGYRMELAIVAFATFWPMLILSRAAAASIEPRLLEVSRALGFGPAARLTKIVLPAALPRVFLALRLSAGIALVVAVTVEIAGNTLGLGYALMDAQQSLRPDLMFALLVWVGLVGWSLNTLLQWSQHRLFGPAAAVEGER